MEPLESGQLQILLSVTINMPWSSQSILLLVLVVASGISCLATYARIVDERNTQQELITQLPLSPSSYSFQSAGRCFGTFAVNTKSEAGSLTIQGMGKIKVKRQASEATLDLELDANFNALRQLGGGYLKLRNSELSVIIGLLNIRPIELSVRILKPALGKIFQSQLDGPIIYQVTNPGSISIKTTSERDVLNSMTAILQQPIFNDIKIIVSSDDPQSRCDADSLTAIDLQPLLNLSQLFAKLIPAGVVP